jgi:hypothetical protein
MANEFKIKKGLIVTGASGGTVVDIQGSQGQLFSVTDNLSGSIFAVSDISGVPIFDVNSSGLSTFDGELTVGANADGHDVLFYGNATGEKMLWDTSESRLTINHDTDDSGFDVFTVGAATMTQPQLRVGRDSGQYWGVYTDDRNAHLVHKQDETTGSMTTRFDQWDNNTSDTNAQWLWRHGNYTGGAMTNALALTQGGDATFAGSITIPDYIYHTSDPNTFFGFDGNDQIAIKTSGNYNFFGDANATALYAAGGVKLKTNNVNVGTATTTGGTLIDGWITTTQANAVNNTTIATTAYVNNKIGLIPAGLQFEGTWDASTGNPPSTSPENGQFWIVSVAGSTSLSGITDWKVGDWAIYVVAGAGTDGWQKVDNSSVLDGFGAGQSVTKWDGSGTSNTLTNGPITFSTSNNNSTFTGSIYANTIYSSTDSSYYIDVVATGLGLNMAGSAAFAGNVTVGTGIIKASIGGDIAITQGAIGLRINDTASSITPTTATLNNDNTVNLGTNNIRWKNLYLGGDINLAAGKKLQYSANSFMTPENNVSGAEISTAGTFIVKTGTTPTLGLTLDATQNAIFTGNVTAVRGFFNSGTTNIVATFTSTDGTAGIGLIDNSGNVELTATGNTFQVRPAGGIPLLSVNSSGQTTITNTTNDNTLLLLNGARGRRLRIQEHNTGNGGIAITSQDTNESGTTNASARTILLNAGGGNVGIGTDNPGAKLTVSENAAGLASSITNSSSSGSGVQITAGNGTNNSLQIRNYAGGELMRVQGNGNVGIGTTSPLHDLQIGTAATNGSYSMMIEGNFANNALASNPRLNLIDTNFGITAGKYGSGSADDALGIFGFQGAGRGILFAHTTAGSGTHLKDMRHDMFVDGGTGNVGIGTTSPNAAKLHVETSSGSNCLKVGTTTQGVFIKTTGNVVDYNASGNISGEHAFSTGNIERMRISSAGAIKFNAYGAGTLVTDASGNITVSSGGGAGGPYLPLSAGSSYPLTGDLYLDDGSGASPSLYFKNQSDNFWRYLMESGGDFSIKEGTSTRLTFQAGGNVGIGTTSPSQSLHVVGNIKAFGHIFLQSNANGFRTVAMDTTDGADNQELYLCGGGTASSTRGGQVGVYGNEVSSTGGSVVIVAGNVSTGDIDFLTANTQRMIINNAGNVGIGTTSPLFKLQTNATITGGWLGYLNGTSATFGTNNFSAVHNSTAIGTGTESGINLANNASDVGAPSPIISFSAKSASGSYQHAYAAIYGIKTATGADTNWNKGDLVFATGSSTGPNERMRVTSAGNVGIGLTNPSSKLTIETNAGDGTIELLAVNAATTKNKIIFSEAVLGDESFFIEHDGAGAGADNLLKIHGDGSGGTSSGVTIRRDGRVGIGTNSPVYKLDVAEKIRMVGGLKITPTTSNLYAEDGALSYYGSTNGVYLNGAGANGWLRLQASGVENDQNSINIYGSASAYMTFRTANSTRMIINSAGNVGIGTTSPGYKLDVNGGIQAGGVVTYSKAYGSLNTTGNAVAGLTTSTNGQSAGFTFTCFGHSGGYQKIVYSCYNGGGNWYASKVIDEGTNQLDVVASANSTTITFTFKSISGTMSYTPRVTVEAVGTAINSTYA